jgi:hypothetical protein
VTDDDECFMVQLDSSDSSPGLRSLRQKVISILPCLDGGIDDLHSN